MSPILFNIYAEAMMVEAMEGIAERIRVGGKLINHVRFDDKRMVANTEMG